MPVGSPTQPHSSQPHSTQQRRGLVIGINQYPRIPNKNLRGCVNDARLIHGLLTTQFGFPEAHLRLMLDEEATRDGILGALDTLLEQTAGDDIVVLFFAGHGSRMIDGRRDNEPREALVCHDSGRLGDPNRDIFDLELLDWSRKMRAKTANLTLLFDCCHSGNVSRGLDDDAFGATTREVEPDERGLDAMFGEDGPPRALLAPPEDREQARGASGRSAWLLDIDRAAVLAACRADELAKEDKVPNDRGGKTRHGALTHQLSLALRPGATWREVFEKVAPEVTRRFEDQHPQLEGQVDRVVFATESRQPEPYLLVDSVDAEGRLALGGGAAQGVVVGSTWSVRPPGALHSGLGTGEPLFRIEVVDVGPVSARARPIGPASGDGQTFVQGQRAFFLDQPLERPGLALVVQGTDAEQAQITEALGDHPLLEIVPPDDAEAAEAAEAADGLVQRIPARTDVGPDDPFPALGPLDQDHWAAVGRDGRLLARLEPIGSDNHRVGLAALADNLVRTARFRGILAIRNPDPASRLRDRLGCRILRIGSDGTAEAAEIHPDFGLPIFRAGELADIEVRNDSDRKLRLTLVQLGADRQIELMIPFRNDSDARGGLPLEPGQSVTVAGHLRRVLRRDRRELPGLPLRLPEGFPWAAAPGETVEIGTLTILAFATEAEAHFQFLEQAASRHVPSHPLERLADYYAHGEARSDNANNSRSLLSFVDELEEGDAPPPDWTVVPLTLGMRR